MRWLDFLAIRNLPKGTPVLVVVFKYLTLKHKTPWDFGEVFTPISCPMKNPTGEKIL
jgi:hypothetical protein